MVMTESKEKKYHSVTILPGAHVLRPSIDVHFLLLAKIGSLKLAFDPGATWTQRYCAAAHSSLVSVNVTNMCNVMVSPATSATWRSVSGATTTGTTALITNTQLPHFKCCVFLIFNIIVFFIKSLFKCFVATLFIHLTIPSNTPLTQL